MKDNLLDLTNKLLDRAIQEWALSVQNMSPEDIYIKIEEIKGKKVG